MRNEAIWFRMAVLALVVAGLAILGLSLRGGRRLPREDTSLPSVVGPAPQTPAR